LAGVVPSGGLVLIQLGLQLKPVRSYLILRLLAYPPESSRTFLQQAVKLLSPRQASFSCREGQDDEAEAE
jgi:hypothetical protein